MSRAGSGVGRSVVPRGGSRGVSNLLDIFGQFQQTNQLSGAQQSALGEQVGLRDEVNKAFQTFGAGARNQLIDQFGTESKNVAANFQGRGLAGSSLAGVAQVDLEAEKQGAIGDLEAQIRAGQSQALQGIANNFSGILTGASGQNQQLLSTLIGALGQTGGGGGGGRGGGGGGGGGGSSGGITAAQERAHEMALERDARRAGQKCIGLPVNDFVKCMRQTQLAAKGFVGSGGAF